MKWVRPSISYMFSLAIIYGFIVGKIDTVQFLIIAGGTVAWWFYSREKDKQRKG